MPSRSHGSGCNIFVTGLKRLCNLGQFFYKLQSFCFKLVGLLGAPELNGIFYNECGELLQVPVGPKEMTISIRIQIQQVQIFKYLGCLFTEAGRQDAKINPRIKRARAVANQLWKKVVDIRGFSQKTQLSVYRSLFKSVLTYGHKT